MESANYEEPVTKSLGEIAHEAGEKHGGWARKWRDLSDAQKQEWQAIAEAVIAENDRRREEQKQKDEKR